MARFRGDYKLAVDLHTESLSICRQIGDKWDATWALTCLGEVARLQGDPVSARLSYMEAMAIARELNHQEVLAYLIEEFAALSAAQGEAKRAAILFAAAQALRTVIQVVRLPVERVEVDRNIALVRAQLGEAEFDAAWAEGQAMTMEQAVAYTLEEE